MKKLLHIFCLLAFFATGSISSAYATQYIIQVKNNEFIQNFDSVIVGDTIKWVWIEGNHTTTSNGIPNWATAWSAAIDQFHTSFTYIIKAGGTYNYISVPDAPLMGENFYASYPVGIYSPGSLATDFNILGLPSKNKIEFTFTLSAPTNVSVIMYNLVGNKVLNLVNENFSSGKFAFEKVPGNNISSGIYFISFRAGEAFITKRIVIQ